MDGPLRAISEKDRTRYTKVDPQDFVATAESWTCHSWCNALDYHPSFLRPSWSETWTGLTAQSSTEMESQTWKAGHREVVFLLLAGGVLQYRLQQLLVVCKSKSQSTKQKQSLFWRIEIAVYVRGEDPKDSADETS